MKRYLLLLLVLIISLAGCSYDKYDGDSGQYYKSYMEIPGVTQDEVDAIEALKASKPSLKYGYLMSTEAFFCDDGELNGFAPILYERMGELLGFEFVPEVCNWSELFEKLESGAIDITHELTPSADRVGTYYMTDPIIQRILKIYKKKDFDIDAVAAQREIRCAFLSNTTLYATVQSSWDIPFTPVFLDDETEIVDCFLNDLIDVYIDESAIEVIFNGHNFIDSVEYYPLKYSPISLATKAPETQAIISVIQKYLKSGGLDEIAQLYSQGTFEFLKYELDNLFTDEERAYIAEHNSEENAIALACETENYPSSFYNRKDGEFQGIAIEVLDEIAALTGLVFKPQKNTDAVWSEILEGLESGEYSIVTELFQTNRRAGRFLWADESCYTNNYALLSRSDYPDLDINQVLSKRVGLLENSAFSDIFREWFPDSVDVHKYVNTEEAFKALESGEIELLMMTQNLLLHLTNYLEKPHFKANVVFNYSANSYFGFNKDEQILCSIVNKAQSFVDTSGISETWKRKVFDYNSKLARDMLPIAIVFLCTLSAALAVVIILFAKNKRITRNLEKIVKERTNELELQSTTLSTMFESIPDLVFSKDVDGNFTRCNYSFKKHFNCSDDIIGKNDMTGLGFSEEAAKRFRAADREVINGRTSIVVEEVIPAADGSRSLFETVKTPLVQNGVSMGVICISRNITERKVAYDIVQLTLDNLDSCIYINDIDTGKTLFINDKMSKEFALGKHCGRACLKILKGGRTKRCSSCPVPRLIDSGAEYYIWEEYNSTNQKFYRNTDSIIKWHDGKLVHMQHAVDITELVKMREDLESASRAKGDFLSRMSHEIRTPLNAVIGMNNIAQSSSDMEKIQQCHKKINVASKHLLGLINDILDMSKIEADKFELMSGEFVFEEVLMNITGVIGFRAAEKRQELVVNIGADVPAHLVLDELRFSQVITNLISNAIKFTPEGGRIGLNVERTDEADGEVTLKIEISDTGIGISEEQKQRLFSSFEQADNSIAHKYGGTGLGLAISKRIVELMDGEIWIESELGKGSTFAFTIKARRGGGKALRGLSDKIDRNAVRVLCVDDSDDVRACFARLMRRYGLSCDTASTAAEALTYIVNSGSKSYNLCLIDWYMPDTDSAELTRSIKASSDETKILCMSGADWSAFEQEALDAGVRGFVAKPFYPSSIVNMINEHFDADMANEDEYAPRAEETYDFSEHTILIAEDIEINQEIISAILEETGIVIEFADDGQIAVEKYSENPGKYSVILMDVQMPRLNGHEATRAIRALPIDCAKTVPIIAMTANVFAEDIEACLKAGMNDHVGKPIDSADLYGKLKLRMEL